MRPDILKLLAKRSGLSTFDIKSSPDDQGPSADYYGETASDFGQSQYDTPTSTAILTQPGGLDNLRGERQTNLDKFGNGLVGMVGKGLTTAAEGIINPFYGTVAAIADKNFSSYYNNDFTKSLDDFNKTIDESNPFYQTREEAESTGFAKLWHANTLFRDVLGGAGTSVGAALTGSAYMKAASLVGKALGAGAVLGESAAVLKEVQAIDKSTDALRYVANQALKKTIKDGGKQGVIALLSATAEAGAEGREQIKNIYHNLTHNPDGSEKPMSEGELNYAKLISEQAGDMVFGLNLPVIMADNWISFGKSIWGNKTNDFAKIVGEGSYLNKATGLYEAISKGKGDALKYTLKQIGKPMLAEGNQEMLQFGVGKTASDYYQKKYYNKNAANFADSFTKGMAEAYTTQEGYSAGIIGALSAGLTSPGIVLVSQGRKAFKDEYITNPDNKTVADGVKSLNDYKAIDVRKKYVDNLVRSANLTEDKDAALEANDDFNYHNANDDLLFSYIHNRLKNGKLEETKNELSNFSQLTAAELEEGYGIKINEGNKSKVESLLQRGNISQFVQEKLDKISKIEDTYNSINKLFPKANPDVKELLVYSAQGIDNAKARKKQLNSEITSVLNQPILDQLFKKTSNNKSVNDGTNNFFMSDEGVLLDIYPSDFSEKYALLSKEKQENFKKFILENNDINENVKDELLKKIDDLALLDARQKDFVLTYKALKDPKNQEGFISMSEELWGRYANMLSNKQNQDDEDDQETTDEEEVAPPEVDENGNIIIPSPDQTGVPGESPKGALTLDEILAKGNAAPLDPNNPEGKVDYSADSFGEGDTFLDENGLSWTVVKNKDGNLIAETKGDGLTQGTTIDNIKGIKSVVKNPETANKAQYDQLIEKIKTATNEELDKIRDRLFDMKRMSDVEMNLITARRNYLLENPKKEGAVIPQNETKITEKTEEDIADNLKFGEQPFDQHNDSQLLNEEGLKEDSSQGFTSVINVVMMKIFKHVFDSNGIFRFVHSNVKNDEFPIIENVNNISVKALNEIKKGDKVELKLTNLTAKQIEEIKSVDGFAIGIYFKDELIGFVSEPNKDSSKVINKTEFEARRNALIAYRNSIIKRIKNGETVTETIQKKSNGNLYTKTKSKNGNLSEIVSDRNVLNTIREKDKINGMPIFVVIDKEGNVILPPNNLPKSATEEINKRIDHFNSINRRPNSYKVKGKIMQLVKDLNNEWSLIPIYPGKMNEAVVNKITEALNGFNEQSDGKEIITALNPFIYASLFKKTAVLMVSKDETTGKYILKINGVEGGSISLEDFNKGGALAKEFKNKLLKLKQNIAINKINTANGQKEMLANENLTSNVYEAPHGEYFVQPFLQYTQKQVSESKPSSSAPSASVSTDVKADIEQFNIAKKGSLRRIENSTDPQTIFSEINILQEALKNTKNSKLTLEEQTFIDGKLKDLKDKGYTFKIKKGEVLREGENVRISDNQTLLKPNDVTELEKPLIKKELNRRKGLKQELIKNGYSEEEATIEAGLSPEKNIELVSQDIEVAVIKNGVQEKPGKIAIRFISVKDAELAALGTDTKTNEQKDADLRAQEAIRDRSSEIRNNIIKAYKDKTTINLPISLLKDLLEFDRTQDTKYYTDKELTGVENIKKLKESISKEGLKEPLELSINSQGAIVLSEGNHRIQALIELGYTEVPVKVIGRGSKGEYFTEVRQGKQVTLGLNLNKDFGITKLSESNVIKDATSTNIGLITPSDAKKINDIDTDVLNNDNALSRTPDMTKLSREKFIRYLKSKLPQLSLSELNEIYDLKDTMVDAVGLFKDRVIYLFEGAGMKTAYHEAFHGVFRNLLTPEQREKIISQAREKFVAPTNEELINLQKGLKNLYTKEQLTYLYYEEKLADYFGEYTYNKNDKNLLAKIGTAIRDFFNKIFSIFKIFRNLDTSSIESVFDSINNGKLANLSSQSTSVVNLPIMDEYAASKNLNKIYKSSSTKQRMVNDAGGYFQHIYKTSKISGNTKKPSEIFNEIYQTTLAQMLESRSKIEALEKEKIRNPSPELDSKLLKEQIAAAIAKLTVLNFVEFSEEVKKFLSARGVNIKSTLKFSDEVIKDNEGRVTLVSKFVENSSKIESIEDSIGVSGENQEDDEDSDAENFAEAANKLDKGIGEMTSISGESSASTRIKIFLDTIPILNNGIQVKNSSGWPLYHNFNDIYYYIERNLIDKYSLVEQLDVLNELSQVKPELSQVIELLGYKKQGGTLVEFTPHNNSEEELDALRKDFKTNFTKQMLSYTLVVAEKNKSTNEIKIKIMNSNRSVIKTEILDDWKKQIQVEQLRDPERLALNIDENGAFVANKEVGKSMFEQMTALVKKDEYIKPVVYNTILKKLGIAYSSKTIEFLTEKFNTKGAPEEVELAKKQLNDWKKTLLKVAEKISNGVVNDQSFRIVFESLANEEAKTVSDRHSASFLNGENKNIWAIQLPSFMSKTISKIKNNDTFQAYIDDLQKDPFYKNSPLLKALDEPKLREIINISYLDSLKQDNGSDGVVYTKITDEDFLISSVALYFNNFQNTKRETGSSATVHKYMYLTNSDKSMAPIVDWISYGVNINEEGKIVASSPIVGEMYNVFTQEVDRINHNKNLISNIIKTKDFNKLNKLKDYYHLSIENFRTLSKYIAETKDAKDANWDEIGKLLEQKSGSAFKFNYFDNSKISKLLEGNLNNATEQKIKNFITEYLNELAKNEKADWIENGLIAMKDGKLILNNLEKPYYAKPGDNVNDIINKMIAQYSANTLLNNIQFSSIFNGDVAGYKIGDIQKRTPQSSALVSQGDFGDNKIIRTIVKKDHYSKSESYFAIKKGLEFLLLNTTTSGLSKEKIDKIVNAYLNTNSTDSQVFITPAFFKRVLKSRGLWNDKIDLAFRIAQGQVVGSIDSSMHTLLGALKPFYNGNRFDEELGIQVFEQVKCSMMPLFKTLIADSPLLLEKAEELKSKRADMIAFDSSFKGFLGYRDEVGADPIKDNVIELSTDNFGIQVENPNHIDSGNDATRQMKMQMVGTIDVSKTFNGTSGQVIRDNILLMESTNITESLNELSNVLNGENKAKFMVFVKDMITKRGASINVEEALTVVKNEFLHALDNGVSSSQVENMISSVFTNRVIKQKFKRGGSAVQATSLGFKHTNLKEQQAEITSINEKGEIVVINEAAYKLQSGLKYMEPNPETGETGYIECGMPADKAHFFNKDGFLKDITKIPPELLQLVAYRIPTEPMHSMMAVKVVKFFPPTVGNFMLLPYEVTTQLGADFDFDKIYFIGRDFHMAANGDYKIYSYNDENSNKARLQRFNDYNEYNIENGNPTISFSDFAELSIPLQNSKGARDNEIVNNYLKLLTSIENLPSLVKPSGFDEMTKFKNLHFGENETKPHVFFTPRRQRSLKRENHTSRILKGIWALHISGHSYASLMPLSINRTETSNHRAVKFNNTVENALNNLYNVDKDIIAEVIAAVEAAVLDDVKNPLLEKLNINAQTSNVLALILRAGFNLNTMMLFSSQPVIRELSKKLLKNRKNIRSNTDEYQTVQSVIDFKLKRLNSVLEKENLINNNDFINLIEYNSLKNLSDEDIPTSFSLDDSEMLSTLNNRKKESEITNKELAIKLAFQLKVLVQFKNYQSIADPISKTNEFFAINKEAGPNIEDIIQKNYVYNDLTKEDGLLTGFDINEIPTLKATWEAHKSALRYMQNYFPFSTTAYNSIKKEAIRKISNKSIANVPIKTRNYMNNFIRIFSDYKFNFYKEILDEEELISNHLPFALKNMFKPFFAEETFTDKVGSVRPNISIPYFKNNDLKNKKLMENLFLNSIKPIWDEKNKHWSIQLKANRVSLPEKNNIIDSFTALYQNENTRELAKGIIKNVYLHTGMHTGVKSIHGIISPELLEKLGYDDYRKKEVSDLNFNKRVYGQEERDRLIDQMIRNNPKDFTKVYEEDMFLAINGKDKPLEIIKTNRDLVKTAKKTNEMYFKIDGAEENPIYIRVYNKRFKKALLYKLSIKNIENGDLSYKLTSPLGRKAFKIEANPFEDIINSTLPNNNNASAPEFEEVAVPKEPSEMNSDTKEINNKTFVEIKEPFEAINEIKVVKDEPFGGEDAQDLTKFIASKKNKQEDKEETNEESCGTAPF